MTVEKPLNFEGLPIVVGITGHRDIPPDAVEPLRERFGEILGELQTKYPSTPLLVLSALAAGADVLAAEEALARGIRVMACLPMDQTDYEQDFTPEQTERFRSVLSRCSSVTVASSSSDRQQAYAAAGTHIVYYSQLLVAFWDGEAGSGPGGTADMVRLRRTGIPSVMAGQIIPYLPDIGPVFQIVTPRENKPLPREVFTTLRHYPPRYDSDTRGQSDFEAALANLDRYNRDVATQPLDRSGEPLVDLMTRTDEAANKLQGKYVQSLHFVYGFALFAGAAQIVEIPGGPIIRMAILALAFLFFRAARKQDYENRYQDYRAISEGLRVQNAWCSAGLRERMVDAAYLRMQHSELQWIRMAIRTAYLVFDARTARGGESTKSPACMQWVEGQRDYYKRAAQREEQKKRRITRISEGSVVAGFALTIIVIALANLNGNYFSPKLVHDQQGAWYHGVMLRLNGMHLVHIAWLENHPRFVHFFETVPAPLAAMAALLMRFYTQQRGFSESARRYQRMFTVFDYAARRLHDIHEDGAQDSAHLVIEELGREALTEHADWLILHRERPLQFVQA